ncbi:acyl-CoA/acyl-ACP dehydrogenase [Actinoplanes sp. KI2]|uniref:acyl-CoA dehydrogenase family protein n=1 Tax=Actinoplanes sp. KI2 TaxID=2983315 RepID=UPI0021D5F050|nr:acyl-CoA dehydrogenase family protein [Actinoplanes sp. KI2]MCU7724261.1 acyl-CoA/acyl-ACP dehydrogenase [Actinoplanes sp. KI2]
MGPDFALDEAQEAIVRLAGEVLSDNADTPERLWKSLAQAGLLGLAVPAELGGAGLGPVETGLLLTEIGRRAAPVPAWSTLSLGVLPLARWGGAEQQRDLLPAVLEGRVLTAALGPPGTGTDRVTGQWSVAPDADRAHRVIVPTESGLALVDPAGPGVTVRPVLRLEDAPAEPIGGNYQDLSAYAVAGACALGDGALAGALAMTAGHLRDRHQFGRPLATFQAVAQQIADVYIASRTMHLISLTAGWTLDERDLAIAAAWLAGEALPALRTCHHLHGGLGLDVEYPLHRHTALVRDLVRDLDRLGADGVHRPV